MIEVFQQHQSCRIAGKFSYQTNDIFLKNNEQNAVVCKNTLKRQSVIRFGLLGVFRIQEIAWCIPESMTRTNVIEMPGDRLRKVLERAVGGDVGC